MKVTAVVKCIIWDLDHTIWSGVLLEDPQVTLKPRISDVIKTLDRRGILHSIASRNDAAAAMAKLEELGIAEYFLYPEIGWNAKSVSVKRIRDNLNIGYDALLFIDDQPFERDEVASVHGGVWCLDSRHYLELLEHPRLMPEHITPDSALRRRMYLDDMRRQEEQQAYVGPAEGFLRQLQMVLEIAEASESDLVRAEELTYRTNQLNATGRQYTVAGLEAMRRDGSHRLLVCGLSDKYGSYGKIGLAVICQDIGAWKLELLLFSCRVLSAGVGNVFLTHLRHAAKARGVRLLADFRDTGRNRLMRASYMVAGFADTGLEANGMTVLENDLRDLPPLPDHLQVRVTVDW